MDRSAENPSNQPKRSRNRKQNWEKEQTTTMLHLMREEQVNGRIGGPGSFTQQFWNRLTPILNGQSHPPREPYELFGRWKTIKTEFSNYKQCVSKTGWGWHPDFCWPVAPDDNAWEELRQNNSKLYNCKNKPFIWYDIINEICGSRVARGNCGVASRPGVVEELVSLSDSSDSNQKATQELKDFNLNEFRNCILGVDVNLTSGGCTSDMKMEDSPTSRYHPVQSAISGATSGTSSGKRARDGSVGNEYENEGRVSSGKKSKGETNKSKGSKNDDRIDMIINESRERRNSYEEVKNILLGQDSNKGKECAHKLFKLTTEGQLLWMILLLCRRRCPRMISTETYS